MTTKEIAKSLGKHEATVARWVEKASRKVQEISRKVQEAKATSVAAEYDLAETCLIIEEGMGKDVADTFRTNAASAEISAKIAQTTDHNQSVLTAALVREMVKLYGHDAAARIDHMIGFKPLPTQQTIPMALPAPVKSQTRIAAPKIAKPMKDYYDGQKRIRRAATLSPDGKIDLAAVLGVEQQIVNDAAREAKLGESQRYPENQAGTINWNIWARRRGK